MQLAGIRPGAASYFDNQDKGSWAGPAHTLGLDFQYFPQEIVVPAGSFSFASDAILERVLFDQADCEAFEEGQVRGKLSIASAVVIFVKDDVENPMARVFDGPVRTHDIRELLAAHETAYQIIATIFT